MTTHDLPLFVAMSRPLVGKEQLEPLLPAHLEYMTSLEIKGTLFASGPFTDGAFGEGMTIVRASSLAEAKQILDADPFIQQQLRTYLLREWRLKEGAL